MFAIIGTWPVDDKRARDQLTHITATVSGRLTPCGN